MKCHADRCHRQVSSSTPSRPSPVRSSARSGVHGEVPHQPEGAGDQLREDPRRQGRQGPHGADRQKYRAVILHPEKGDVYVLVWVDNHDEAMAWAGKRGFEVNPVAGSLQVFSFAS